MATSLTLDQMKTFVRDHFEEFVNQRKVDVIHKNRRHTSLTTTGRAASQQISTAMNR